MRTTWPNHITRKPKLPIDQAKSLARKTPKALKEAAEDEIIHAIERQIKIIQQDGDKELAEAVKKIGELTARNWGFANSFKLG
jgi:hypothetical protein